MNKSICLQFSVALVAKVFSNRPLISFHSVCVLVVCAAETGDIFCCFSVWEEYDLYSLFVCHWWFLAVCVAENGDNISCCVDPGCG